MLKKQLFWLKPDAFKVALYGLCFYILDNQRYLAFCIYLIGAPCYWGKNVINR